MTAGRVTGERAIIDVIVRGPWGDEVSLEAMIDTGLNGHLKLPTGIISSLRLAYERDAVVMLADEA